MGTSTAPRAFPPPIPFSQSQPNIVTQVKPLPMISPMDNPPAPALLNDPGTTINGASQPAPTAQNPLSDVQSRIQALRSARMGGSRMAPMPFFGS